jgi:hypothetical protein
MLQLRATAEMSGDAADDDASGWIKTLEYRPTDDGTCAVAKGIEGAFFMRSKPADG